MHKNHPLINLIPLFVLIYSNHYSLFILNKVVNYFLIKNIVNWVVFGN